MNALSELEKIYRKNLNEMSNIELAIWFTAEGTTAYDMDEAAAELAALRARVEELEQAAKQAIPYLENCAKHHRDDYVLEDVIIPQLAAALAAKGTAKEVCPSCTWRGDVELVNGVCPQCDTDWHKLRNEAAG